MTHYRAPAVGSVRPTEGNRSDGSRFWRYWQTLPGLIQALTPLILGLVAGGAAGVTLGQHPSTPAPQPRATVTVTARPAPQPTVTVAMTASAPPPASTPASQSAGPSVYSQGPVGITSDGLNFDTKPPSSTPSGTIYYAGGLYASSTNIEFAIWPNSSTPTAAQCQNWVTTHPSPSLLNVNPGMQICIKTDQGRFGLLHIESVDGSQVSATATIWGT
jgi:hypothetical protein